MKFDQIDVDFNGITTSFYKISNFVCFFLIWQ